jgi:hypothetical protein
MKVVPYAVTRSIGNSILKTKSNSPHIFFAAGVAGIVGGTVLACRATLKLEDTLESINDDISAVKDLYESKKDIDAPGIYDETEHYKDLAYVYSKGASKLVRLYAPAVVVGVASVGALTGAHVQLTRRNAALTATVGMLSTAYEAYRDRVREELGTEREIDIYHAVDTTVVTNPDGAKEVVKVVDPNKLSDYSKFFDESCSAWEKDAEINRLKVQHEQNWFNEKLRARGHVFLNEVYDAFGMERTSAGSVVGWVLGGDGDNYIDFGLFDAYSSRFVNGLERSILLDFNVDGVIFDKI